MKPFTYRVTPTFVPTQALGYTPEAQSLENYVYAKHMRQGVHMCRGMEFASVFDLVGLCTQKLTEALSYTPNVWFDWHLVAEDAFASNIRMQLTCGHYLMTDDKPKYIRKWNREFETYFVAIEDFAAYLKVITKHSPVIGAMLEVGWEVVQATGAKGRGNYNF